MTKNGSKEILGKFEREDEDLKILISQAESPCEAAALWFCSIFMRDDLTCEFSEEFRDILKFKKRLPTALSQRHYHFFKNLELALQAKLSDKNAYSETLVVIGYSGMFLEQAESSKIDINKKYLSDEIRLVVGENQIKVMKGYDRSVILWRRELVN